MRYKIQRIFFVHVGAVPLTCFTVMQQLIGIGRYSFWKLNYFQRLGNVVTVSWQFSFSEARYDAQHASRVPYQNSCSQVLLVTSQLDGFALHLTKPVHFPKITTSRRPPPRTTSPRVSITSCLLTHIKYPRQIYGKPPLNAVDVGVNRERRCTVEDIVCARYANDMCTRIIILHALDDYVHKSCRILYQNW